VSDGRRRRRTGLPSLALSCAVAVAVGCGSDSAPSTPNIPVAPTPPAPPPILTEAILVGAGDIGDCRSAGVEQTARLLDGIPGTVFTAGDNAYPHGRLQDFVACYHPTWGRHLHRTWAAAGNHEYETPGAAGHFEYFGERAGPGQAGFHAYDVGAWRVITLNSNIPIGAGSLQFEWLQSELRQTRAACVAAIWHHPLYSSGPNGDNPRVRDPFALLHEYGAEIVIAAHDHLYERQSPIAADGRVDARGVRPFIVGTGGAALYRTGGSPRPMTETRVVEWGVLKLTLSPGAYRWEFVTAGGVRDAGSDRCH
jgi:hypothetical protein